MSGKKSDLPGYYRDPKTGKYYREPPQGAVNPSLSKLKTERKEEASKSENFVKALKITNIPKLFRSRELGSISGLPFKREYYTLRTFKQKVKMEVSLNGLQPNKILSVGCIKLCRDSVLGVWNIEGDQNHPCVVAKKTLFGLDQQQPLEFELCRNFITDICEGPDHSMIYVCNDIHNGTGHYHYFGRENTVTRIHNHTPIFCCESAQRGAILAYGCAGFFMILNNFAEKVAINGRVHALSFDETSNIIVSGANTGYMNLYDIREQKLEMEFPVSEKCLTDISFLNIHQVIVTGVDNVLVKVDLRMKKPVTEFFGHVCLSVKKRPFSFADNMLCVNGSDNVSRIWHLSGGSPIYEMKPLGPHYNQTRALLYGDANKTYFYHFEKDVERVSECLSLRTVDQDWEKVGEELR